MKRIAIVVRHGEYDNQLWGDGPLTNEGAFAVEERACLIPLPPDELTYSAVVSGSLRGMETYFRLKEALIKNRRLPPFSFAKSRELIHTDFFTTPEERAALRDLRQSPAFIADEKKDPDGAMLKHGLEIFRGPASRNVKAIREQTSTMVVFNVTHAIVDMLTVNMLSNDRMWTPLDYGCFRVVEFE